MTENQILQRVTRLERRLDKVQKQLAHSLGTKADKTWRDYIGMFKDDPDFEKAMTYGARWRRSFKPKPDAKARKK